MIALFIIIIVLYVALMGYFIYGYSKVKEFNDISSDCKTRFSVIIPFRNESESLRDLLASMSELDYPNKLFEIILVDDASEDTSVEIIQSYFEKNPTYNYQLLENQRMSNSPKKDAITTAIQKAKYDWIVTTDADCILPKYWLNILNTFILKNDAKMVVAPVDYYIKNRRVEQFQLMDFWSLQTVTVSGFGAKNPFLNNGANLAYQKTLFHELQGFDGNDSIASGDDQFIMEKLLQRDLESVMYLKSKHSVVITKPQPNWQQLFYQRVRWAAKASSSSNSFSKLVGLVVFLMNASVIIGLTLVIIQELSIYYFAIILTIKYLVDYQIVYKSAAFFDKKTKMKHFTLSSVFYPFFSVSVVCYSLFFKYKWKGRSFKK